MPDQDLGLAKHMESPSYDMFTITPSGTDFTNWTRGIYVSVSGNATVITMLGTTITLNGLLAGTVYPFRLKQCTSATATLIGLY